MAKILTFSNRKGGAGKTTLAFNVACYLNARFGRTLLIDLDSQAHATIHAGLNPFKSVGSVYELFVDFLHGKPVSSSYIVKAPELDIIPASEEVSALEIELSELDLDTGVQRISVLKDIMIELSSDYNFVIIDTPPSLGLLTLNALTAADYLIIPFKVDFFSMVGIGEMMNLYYRVTALYSPELRLLGVVPINFTPRSRISGEIFGNLKKNLGEHLILPQITQDIKFVEAASHGRSILSYAPNSKGANQIRQLSEEILRRIL